MPIFRGEGMVNSSELEELVERYAALGFWNTDVRRVGEGVRKKPQS